MKWINQWKVAMDSTELNEVTIKRTPDAKYGRTNFTNITKLIIRDIRGILATKLHFDYGKFTLGNSANIHSNRRGVYRLVPFPKGVLQTGRCCNICASTNRHYTRARTSDRVAVIIIATKRKTEKHEVEKRETIKNWKKLVTGYAQSNANFQKTIIWMEH